MTTPALPQPTEGNPAPASGPGTPPAENPSQTTGTDAGQSGEDVPLGPAGERALAAVKAELAAAKAKVKEYEPLAAKARELEQAQMTEAQRAEAARVEAENRAAAATLALNRYRIGAELALPPFLTERIQGGSEDEMRADAQRLAAEWSGRPPVQPPPPSGAGDAGRTGSPAGTDMNTLLRNAVRR